MIKNNIDIINLMIINNENVNYKKQRHFSTFFKN